MKGNKTIGFITLIACLVFAIVISLYHLKGADSLKWLKIWEIAENGLLLTMSLYIAYLSEGFMKIFFRWVFPPYFIVKLVYHLSCYVGIYIMSPARWEQLWSGIVVAFLLTGLVFTIIRFTNGEINGN